MGPVDRDEAGDIQRQGWLAHDAGAAPEGTGDVRKSGFAPRRQSRALLRGLWQTWYQVSASVKDLTFNETL